MNASLMQVLQDITDERERQDAKHGAAAGGPGHALPDGTSTETFSMLRDAYQRLCQHAAGEGVVTWSDIFLEEVYEAMAEEDDDPLRKELIQVAAVCVAWVQDIDSRSVGGR